MSNPSHLYVSGLLQQGIEFQHANRLEEAEACYLEALKIDPGNADAIHLLGMLAFQIQDYELAVDLIRSAIDLNANIPFFYNNLGNAFFNLGRHEEALENYARALELNPHYPEALYNYANTAHAEGRAADAIESYRKLIKLDPNFIEAYNNLGALLRDKNIIEEAIACFRKAHALNSAYKQAADNLFSTLLEKGAAAMTERKYDEAISCFQDALEAHPNSSDAYSAYFQMGHAYQKKDQLDEAIESHLNAIRVNPALAEAYDGLGLCLSSLGQDHQAIDCFNKAITLSPDKCKFFNNIAFSYAAIGEHVKAIETLRQALALIDATRSNGLQSKEGDDKLKNDVAGIIFHMSMSTLSIGKIQLGFEEYEGRFAWEQAGPRYSEKSYEGKSLFDKTILIWGEQGVGDEILFASVLPDVINAAGHCIIEIEPRLVTLFARSFPSAEVVPMLNPPHARTLQPDIQLQMPIGSLPRWFRQTIESFPQHHGYLTADPERVAFWKNRLAALGNGPKIGICWRSKLRSMKRDLHYTTLSQWRDILTVQGVVFVNLQYDDAQAELSAAQDKFGVTIHTWKDIDLMNDLDDAAALTAALDLVISAGTSVAGMAGALGKETWMCTLGSNWVKLGTCYLPWIPSIKLYEKTLQENWDPVLKRIGKDLRQYVDE